MKVRHDVEVVIGEYQFADSLNKEVLHNLQFCKDTGHTNVKASLHTGWDWLPENSTFKKFKSFIISEIEKNYQPGMVIGGKRHYGFLKDFWGNVYKKGDYAISHAHPSIYSFAYFVKSKWYDSPLVFDVSKKRIRPKDGKYVIFPSYLMHSVPRHRFNHERITLSGNYYLTR